MKALDKEAIEAEGWEVSPTFCWDENGKYQEGGGPLLFYNRRLNIGAFYHVESQLLSVRPPLGEYSGTGEPDLYNGPCRTIKEFRKIIEKITL